MRYIRCVLNVKASTSNVIVIGECGRYPPSVFCHISLLCFFNRMYDMSDAKLAKQVYSELLKLLENGFPNWISNVTELLKLYEIDIFGPRHNIKQQCKRAVTEHHIKEWRTSFNDVKSHPIWETYNLIKTRHGTDPYLYKENNSMYRTAIAKLQTSSHSLEIKRGRYTKPKTPAHQRLCSMCKTVEDEFQFIMECQCNSELRHGLFDKMCNQYKNFD